MTYQAIPTHGDNLVLVGHVHAFPRHPAPATPVEPLVDGYTVNPAEFPEDLLYALVSVEWATPVTDVDPESGESATRFLRGFGTPTEVTWYLTPATFDANSGQFILNNSGLARGHRDARLPAELEHLGAPSVVPIHDFAV